MAGRTEGVREPAALENDNFTHDNFTAQVARDSKMISVSTARFRLLAHGAMWWSMGTLGTMTQGPRLWYRGKGANGL